MAVKTELYQHYPVSRVKHVALGNLKDGSTLLLHRVNDIYKEMYTKRINTYDHTYCGHNMAWTESPRSATIEDAVQSAHGDNTGVVICPKCFPTEQEFLEALETERLYDVEQQEKADLEKEQEDRDRKVKWDSMCNLFQSEIRQMECEANIDFLPYDQYEDASRRFYIVEYGKEKYRIDISISPVKE